jgi:hypothetical protein
MHRRLLNIASVVCLILCVALIGMWVRSYYEIDELTGHFADRCVCSINTMPGRLRLGGGFPDESLPDALVSENYQWSV